MPRAGSSEVSRLPLWLRLLLAAFFLVSVTLSARQVAWYWSHGPVVSDMRIFMTGIEVVRHGDRHQLYSFAEQEAAQNRLYPATKSAGLLPFNHLAYELVLYWPLARLSYRSALMAWGMVNLALVLLVAWLARPYTVRLRSLTGIPTLFWILAFYPVLYVFGEAQDSLIFLCLIVLSLRSMERDRPVLAGIFLGLAFFKFHLALMIAGFAFVLPRRWRAMAGFAATALLVTFLSRLMVGPTFARDYFSMLQKQSTMTPWGFVPWFMPNLRGLLQWGLARWLEIGFILPIIFVASVALVVLTAWACLRSGRRGGEAAIYCAAVLCTVLVSYHLHMQDLTIAILPVLILLERTIAGKIPRPWSATLLAAAAALYSYRIAAAFAPILLVRGCWLAGPVLLLWVAAMTEVGRTPDRAEEMRAPRVAASATSLQALRRFI